jgi:hypothetical protein
VYRLLQPGQVQTQSPSTLGFFALALCEDGIGALANFVATPARHATAAVVVLAPAAFLTLAVFVTLLPLMPEEALVPLMTLRFATVLVVDFDRGSTSVSSVETVYEVGKVGVPVADKGAGPGEYM